MALVLNTTIKLFLNAILQNTVGLSVVQGQINSSPTVTLESGTGAGKADRVYSETRTLGASANTELDLAGVLTDIFGSIITFARIKAILIVAAAANTNDVVLGAAAATVFRGPLGSDTDTLKTKPGGVTLLVAPDATGWVVGAGTTDKLKLANSGAGTPVVFDLVIIGASV